MPTITPSLATPMQREINKQLLKHIAGKLIFCPICSDIMDYRRTVAVSFMKGDTPVATKGCCGECFVPIVLRVPSRADAVARYVANVEVE
jgi:hypothetical protein